MMKMIVCYLEGEFKYCIGWEHCLLIDEYIPVRKIESDPHTKQRLPNKS